MSGAVLRRVAAAACVAGLLVCGGLLLFRAPGMTAPGFDDGPYTVGGAVLTDPVENLEIDWTSGSVTIAYHPGNTVEISETASRPLTEEEALRWQLDGTTLRIRYAKARPVSLRTPNKALTVTLPEGLALGRTVIDATSGEVIVPELRTGAAEISVTSGVIRAALTDVKTADLTATSGDIDLQLTGAADRVRLNSTSGAVRADLGRAAELRVAVTSGTIELTAEAGDTVDLGCTSGDIVLSLGGFRELEIGTTSGNVTAALPASPGFRAEIGTTSGRVESDIPLRQTGRVYACGDESARATITTTSGDVRLTEHGG